MGKRGQTRKIAAAFVLGFLSGAASAAECRDDRVHLRGDWGQAFFNIEVADDRAEQAQGLMHRDSMPQTAGMLFVYPFAKRVGFWMKNTLIPLDMIFVDPTGTVQHVHHMAEPLNLTPIFGGNNTIAVLEINGGRAEKLGISKGSQLRHPAFDTETAAWPC